MGDNKSAIGEHYNKEHMQLRGENCIWEFLLQINRDQDLSSCWLKSCYSRPRHLMSNGNASDLAFLLASSEYDESSSSIDHIVTAHDYNQSVSDAGDSCPTKCTDDSTIITTADATSLNYRPLPPIPEQSTPLSISQLQNLPDEEATDLSSYNPFSTFNISSASSDTTKSSSQHEWSFTLYDFDGRGRITKQDLTTLIRSLYDVLGTNLRLKAKQGDGACRLRVAFDSPPSTTPSDSFPPPHSDSKSGATPAQESAVITHPHNQKHLNRRSVHFPLDDRDLVRECSAPTSQAKHEKSTNQSPDRNNKETRRPRRRKRHTKTCEVTNTSTTTADHNPAGVSSSNEKEGSQPCTTGAPRHRFVRHHLKKRLAMQQVDNWLQQMNSSAQSSIDCPTFSITEPNQSAISLTHTNDAESSLQQNCAITSSREEPMTSQCRSRVRSQHARNERRPQSMMMQEHKHVHQHYHHHFHHHYSNSCQV